MALALSSCQTQQASLDQTISEAGQQRRNLELPPRDTVLGAADDGAPGESDPIATGAVSSNGNKAGAGTKGGAQVNGDEIVAYVPPKPGTILHYRNNWATLPSKTAFRVDPVQRIGTSEYVRLAAVGGREKLYAYHDAANYALKGYRDGEDKAVVTFKPVEERYRFPMKPGDKWLSQWQSMSHRDNKVSEGGGVVEVIRMETIRLPAGEFRAMKVRLPLPANEFPDMRHFVWFSPELGVTIKEEITNGRINWTQVLEKVKSPG